MPEIFKLLDLNTGHLPFHICQGLNGFSGVFADERQSLGWLLHVPQDVDAHVADYRNEDEEDDNGESEDSIPGEVIAVWRFARKYGCDYVLLDSDGPKYDDLTIYDW